MQADWIPRNTAERIRNRAFNVEARAGRYDRYWRLVNLSLEVSTIRNVAP